MIGFCADKAPAGNTDDIVGSRNAAAGAYVVYDLIRSQPLSCAAVEILHRKGCRTVDDCDCRIVVDIASISFQHGKVCYGLVTAICLVIKGEFSSGLSWNCKVFAEDSPSSAVQSLFHCFYALDIVEERKSERCICIVCHLDAIVDFFTGRDRDFLIKNLILRSADKLLHRKFRIAGDCRRLKVQDAGGIVVDQIRGSCH